MHNLKEIRNDFKAFRLAIEKRNVNIDFGLNKMMAH